MTELMVAVALLSIGALGFFGAFKYIARSIFVSRAQSLATNLGQERIESLKNLNYFALQLSTDTDTTAPSITYDTVNYPPETIAIGGITFLRYTYVTMAEVTNGDVSIVGPNYPDTGLKQIEVNIVWTEANTTKKWTLKNLLENPAVNPLDATITGTVNSSAGGTVASALVEVEGNSDWSGNTNAAGVFTFQVYHGTYTLRASSAGFTDATSGPQVVARGTTKTVSPNMTLSQIATGYIQGTVWYNPSLVISQVVANTTTMVADSTEPSVEYVELFNPTTFPINLGVTGAATKNVALYYRDETGTERWDITGYANNFFLTHIATYVAPGRYYLIANASSFVISGAWITADAYYDDNLSMPLTYPNYILNDKAGSISLYQASLASPWIDHVGWADNNNAPAYYEGIYIPDFGGLNDGIGTPAGKQVVRVSSPGISAADLPNYGRAYDSDSNARDFLYETASDFRYPPKNHASGVFTTITGKVPSLASVSASDPNSGSTQTFTAYVTSAALTLPYSKFILGGVSTGTWTISAAYTSAVFGGFAAAYDNVAVAQNLYKSIPNATSVPVWSAAGLYHVMLTSSSTEGYVKGIVSDANNTPVNGITVQVGGIAKITGANGQYFTPVSTGPVTIVANPNNSNASYTQDIQTPTITQGAVTTQNFTLSLAGRLTGYVTTGTTPLSNQPIAATLGGSQVGSATTDAAGNFSMRNLSTGTYTIFPVLESGQDTSPNTFVPILTTTGTLFVGTFTITGALGSIAGTISDAAGYVTSGALLVASTNTISATLPLIAGSSAQALVPIYMVSSKADGTYILPVRGGYTYYLSAFVPVINGMSVSVTTKTYNGIAVSPSAATTKNVSIP